MGSSSLRRLGNIPTSRTSGTRLSVSPGSAFDKVHPRLLGIFHALDTMHELRVDKGLRCVTGELKGQPVHFECESYESSTFHRVRSVSFSGAGYDVYNFVAIPRPAFDLPIFGLDVVRLPGRVLAALDFQPMTTNAAPGAYEDISRVHADLATRFPPTGELPTDAARYFSPHALFFRAALPQNPAVAAAAAVGETMETDKLLQDIQDAMLAYAQSYSRTAGRRHEWEDSTSSREERAAFLAEYLQYRIDKDPAKGMLAATFGSEWVNSVLSQVVFPRYHEDSTSASERKGRVRMYLGRDVVFVTGNENKRAEVEAILGRDTKAGKETTTVHAHKLDLPELQGHPVTIVKEKCRLAREALLTDNPRAAKLPIVVEDTSLCFEALGELPGPYVKWFLDAGGHEGLNNMLAAYDDKTAFAQCTVALSSPDEEEPVVFVGRTYGKIVPARSAGSAFGWDPVFQPDDGDGRTYGEMSKDEKNGISHRYKAFAKLSAYLEERERG